MSLTAADVAEIMRLVEQSCFDELTLEIDGMKLELRRGTAAGVAKGGDAGRIAPAGEAMDEPAAGAGDRGATPGVATPGATAPGTMPGVVAAPLDPAVAEVPSPLLGTYYRAAKPGAVPYVEVGTETEEDTIIGIIEVMKLMNAVRAGVRGTVTEILLADGALAEYGQTLVRIRRSG